MSDDRPRPSLAEERRKLSPKEAREQAAEAEGFLASIEIVIGDETFEIAQRGLLDDDARERMNQLDLDVESWDREDDVMVKMPDGSYLKNPDGTYVKQRGPLKVPYRKNNELIKPAYPVLVAIALWGEEKYERFKRGGGRATDVTGTLARLDKRLEQRASADPHLGGHEQVESVSD